jgi:hypothetical protein
VLQPSGRILYYPPGVNGYASAFGHARDWYPDEKWLCWNCEWVEPLRAIGPRPDLRPQATSLSQFTQAAGYHNLVRDVTLSGNPAVSGIQYYDGTAFTGAEDMEDYTAALVTTDNRSPNWVLHLVRNSPPPSQAILTHITVAMEVTHTTLGAGRLAICWPLGNDTYPQPFIHWIAPTPAGAYDMLTQGTIVRTMSGGSGAKQGGHREGIVCQVEQVWRNATTQMTYAEDTVGATYLGSHVLLRNVNNLEQWTAWWVPELTFADAPLRVTIAGAVQSFSLAPLEYGGPQASPYTAHTEPPDACAVPTAANGTWATSPEYWATVPSLADDWTVAVAESSNGRKPSASMTRTAWTARYVRPLIWRVGMDVPATITKAAPAGTWPQDTRDGDLLESVTVTLDADYKGATGSATIRPQWPQPLDDWAENGQVAVSLGLAGETGLWAEQTVLTGRILPDGLKPSRSGTDSGRPALTVDFGDLAGVLRNKVMLDWRSYAARPLICTAAAPCNEGATGYCWLHALGNRLGLAYDQVAYDDGSIDWSIPVNTLPSTPTLLVPDGASYLEHIREVEAACGVRVRFDYAADGLLSLDTGAPAYSHGVSEISFVLDEDETDVNALVTGVQVDRGGARWRNAAKFRLKLDRHLKGDVQEVEYYWLDAEADRLATVVDDWWAYYGDDDATSLAQLWRRYQQEGHRWTAAIRWTMPLCPGLRPDAFVQLNVNSLGLAYGSVYQITQHTMTANVATSTAMSELTATIVYPGTEGPY